MKKFGKVIVWLGIGVMFVGLCGMLFDFKNVYYAVFWAGLLVNMLGQFLRDWGKDKELEEKYKNK